eukprot:s5812_g1.t1
MLRGVGWMDGTLRDALHGKDFRYLSVQAQATFGLQEEIHQVAENGGKKRQLPLATCGGLELIASHRCTDFGFIADVGLRFVSGTFVGTMDRQHQSPGPATSFSEPK